MDLTRAQRDGTPLIDGDQVTFLWQGEQAPTLLGDFNNWSAGATPFREVDAGLWAASVTLPRDAYIEYAYVDGDGNRVPDPLNAKRTIYNGVDADNHFFAMPEYAQTPFATARRSAAKGKVTDHVIKNEMLVAGGKRTVHFYHPPTDEAVPLIVVYDGQDFLKRATLPTILDNLIAQARIHPVALAMIDHGKQARFLEYMSNEATLGLLVREVLPLAREHLNLVDVEKQPGAYGVMGASMGGLMALFTGLRLPTIFGNVFSLSGAFGFSMDGYEQMIFDLVRLKPRSPINVWMNVGRYEGLLEPNRRMVALLRELEYSVTYREYAGGHNYTCWRDEIGRGLETLYGLAAPRPRLTK